MKKKLLLLATSVILLFSPNVDFGQAPGLGTAANFVLFSTAGAVGNTGVTHLTGNVGTNTGSSTGFGNIDGQMHDNDVASGACASDLNTAYGLLNGATPTFFPASGLGNGTTLVPGVYRIASAATLNSNLILDGQGSANAVFIFQIQGAFSTGANSRVQLINGALACNVFWKVEGLVSMAAGTTMRGNVIAHNAAISMSAGDTLEGRALSIAGAVTVNHILAYTPIGCGSPYLTGPSAPALALTKYYGLFSSIGPVSNSGITHVTGDVGTNLGLTTGFNPLFVTGMIHPVPDASTATCAADLHNVYLYLNALPYDIELLYPAQFGNNLVLTPHTYIMNAATTFTDSLYLNAEGNANAVFIIKIYGALSTSTFANVRLINGAQAKNVYWLVNGSVLVNDNSVFNGTIIANNGAIQFNTAALLNGRALTTTGAVTVTAMTINADTSSSVSSAASDTTVCIGSSITITPTVTGGTWSSSNAHASVSNGVVTGVTAGIDTITYTAGTATSSNIITVKPTPTVSASANQNVCNNRNTTAVIFSGSVSGTTYAWTNNTTTIGLTGSGSGNIASFIAVNNGIAPVTGTISVTPSANGCIGASQQFTITVNPTPSLSSTLTPAAICNNTLFSYNPTSLTTGTAFSWNRAMQAGISNAASAGINNPNEILTNTNANPLTVVYVDTLKANGCINTQNVVVSVNPSAKLSSQMNNAVCGKIPFLYTAASLTNNATFAWTRAVVAGITPATASGNININETLQNATTSPINVIYHFTLTINGCDNIQDMILTVNPLPAIPVITTTSPATVCAKTLYANFGTSIPPAANVSYSWAAVNAIVWAVGTNGQHALINFTNPGNAEVILTETINGTLCNSSDTFKVTVGTDIAEIATVRYFEYHFICTPSNLDAYQWGYDDLSTLDSTLLPGEINQDYLNANPDFAHKYYWVNTSQNGCKQKTFFNAPLAIQNVIAVGGINVYPNPSKDFINITINTTLTGILQIEILNITGQSVSTTEVTNSKARIDISTLPVGFYMVRCYNGGIIIGSTKFIKN